MTSPINSKQETHPINPPKSINPARSYSYWDSRKIAPYAAETGFMLSAVGSPLMTAGVFHGFSRTFSSNYRQLSRRYPTGAVIFLGGLGCRTIGNSLIFAYSESTNL